LLVFGIFGVIARVSHSGRVGSTRSGDPRLKAYVTKISASCINRETNFLAIFLGMIFTTIAANQSTHFKA
jgi:hypothetical protein